MPAFSTIDTADLLAAATRLYTGARDTPAIATALDGYGYAPKDFDAGLTLIAALRDAMQTQGTEQAEKISASKAAALATAAVRVPLVRHRTLARRAHAAGSAGYSALALSGSASQDTTAMLAEARRFYETLAGHEDFAVRSLTPAATTEALAAVASAEAARDAQTRESGEAQHATALRQAAETTLRRSASELAETARIALAEMPQQREVLGLLERGS